MLKNRLGKIADISQGPGYSAWFLNLIHLSIMVRYLIFECASASDLQYAVDSWLANEAKEGREVEIVKVAQSEYYDQRGAFSRIALSVFFTSTVPRDRHKAPPWASTD